MKFWIVQLLLFGFIGHGLATSQPKPRSLILPLPAISLDIASEDEMVTKMQGIKFTQPEIDAVLSIVRNMPKAGSDVDRGDILMQHSDVLGASGVITTISSSHNSAYAQQGSWEEVKNGDFSSRLNYWFANLQITQDSLGKAVALKNMAVIIKKELDNQASVSQGGQTGFTWNFDHVKVDATNEAQVLTTVKTAGLTQMEAWSFIRMMNDLPKATSDSDKQHLLEKHCMILGSNGVMLPVKKLTDSTLTWDEVKTGDLALKLNYWNKHIQQATTVEDSAKAVKNLCVVVKQWYESEPNVAYVRSDGRTVTLSLHVSPFVIASDDEMVNTIQAAGYTQPETVVVLRLLRQLHEAKDTAERQNTIVKECMELGSSGMITPVATVPQLATSWDEVKGGNLNTKVNYWNAYLQLSQTPVEKAKALKNLCVVLKQSVEGGITTTGTGSVSIPIKILTLDVVSESQLPSTAQKIGWTQPETDATLDLIVNWPKLTSELEREALLVRSCSVLGLNGVISPVTMPPQVTREYRPTWDEVKGMGLTVRMEHWYSNMKLVQTPEDKLKCLKNLCIVLKQEMDGVPVGPSTEPSDIPLKLEDMPIGPETDIPTAGQEIGMTKSEIDAVLNLIRGWPTATNDDLKNLLMIRTSLVLGKNGVIVPLPEAPHDTKELRPSWDIVKGLDQNTRARYWYKHIREQTTLHKKLIALKNLCIVILREKEGVPTGSISLPLKIPSLEVSESEWPIGGPVVGLKQPEIDAGLKLIKGWPTAVTEPSKELLLAEHCRVLGGDEVILPLQAPQLTRERRVSWDEVKGFGYLPRLDYWYTNMKRSTDVNDKIRCLKNMCVVIKQEMDGTTMVPVEQNVGGIDIPIKISPIEITPITDDLTIAAQAVGLTSHEIMALKTIVVEMPMKTTDLAKQNLLVQQCLILGRTGDIMPVTMPQQLTREHRFTWEQIKDFGFGAKLGHWQTNMNRVETVQDKIKCLKNMCIVIRQEIDKASEVSTVVPTISIPQTIAPVQIAPELEIPTAGLAVGLTQPEIKALTNLVRDWPKASTPDAKNNVLIQNCMILGKSGMYIPVTDPPQLTQELRLPWSHYVKQPWSERLGYWYRTMQQHQNVHDKIRCLKNMCVAIKQEVDGDSNLPDMNGIDLPIKIDTINIAPESELPSVGTSAGLTQPEIDAALKLIRDLPTVSTEAEKQNLLMRQCMILGKSGTIVPVDMPPQLTRERRLTWDEVKGSSLPMRLNHWNWNMQLVQTPVDKLKCLKNLCVVIKQELDAGTARPNAVNDFPIKLTGLDIAPEGEIRTAGAQLELTPSEIEAAWMLQRDLPKATTDLEKQNLLVRHCMILGKSGIITAVEAPPQLTRERRFTWDEVKTSSFPIRLNHWYWNLQLAQTPVDRLKSLKNMCVVIKQGYQYVPSEDDFSNFNWPLKIDSLQITPETAVAPALVSMGLTPAETDAAWKLLRDLPKASTDVERKNLILRNCLVLGGSGVVSQVMVPRPMPSLTVTPPRRSWNDVMNMDFTTKVNHWHVNFLTLPTPLNKLQSLRNMCALIKQEVTSGNNGWAGISVTSRPTTLDYRPVTWEPPVLRPIALPTIRPITLQSRPLGINIMYPQLNPTIYGATTSQIGVPAVGQVGLPKVNMLRMPQVPRIGLPRIL